MKYKIGDRIIWKASGNTLTGKINNIFPDLRLYNIEFDGGSINLFSNEIELDKEYYRDIKLKEILK